MAGNWLWIDQGVHHLLGVCLWLIVLSFAPSAAAVWHCHRVRKTCERNSVWHSVFQVLGRASVGHGSSIWLYMYIYISVASLTQTPGTALRDWGQFWRLWRNTWMQGFSLLCSFDSAAEGDESDPKNDQKTFFQRPWALFWSLEHFFRPSRNQGRFLTSIAYIFFWLLVDFGLAIGTQDRFKYLKSSPNDFKSEPKLFFFRTSFQERLFFSF